jgi:hypothetical protein
MSQNCPNCGKKVSLVSDYDFDSWVVTGTKYCSIKCTVEYRKKHPKSPPREEKKEEIPYEIDNMDFYDSRYYFSVRKNSHFYTSITQSIYSRWLLARKEFDEGNFERAVKIYHRIEKDIPDSDELHRDIADCYYALKNYIKALHHYKNAIFDYSERDQDFNRGPNGFDLLEYYEKSSYSHILLRKLLCYKYLNKIHKIENMLQLFRKPIINDNYHVILYLAACCLGVRDYYNGIIMLRKGIEKSPNDYQRFENMARFNLLSRNYYKAIRLYSIILEYEPNNVYYLQEQCLALYMTDHRSSFEFFKDKSKNVSQKSKYKKVYQDYFLSRLNEIDDCLEVELKFIFSFRDISFQESREAISLENIAKIIEASTIQKNPARNEIIAIAYIPEFEWTKLNITKINEWTRENQIKRENERIYSLKSDSERLKDHYDWLKYRYDQVFPKANFSKDIEDFLIRFMNMGLEGLYYGDVKNILENVKELKLVKDLDPFETDFKKYSDYKRCLVLGSVTEKNTLEEINPIADKLYSLFEHCCSNFITENSHSFLITLLLLR